MSTDNMPKWVAEEIRTAKFDSEEEWSGSGYILDINKEEKKVDVQFYEKLPEGRYIATLDLSPDLNADTLNSGLVYMFKFKAMKGDTFSQGSFFLEREI